MFPHVATTNKSIVPTAKPQTASYTVDPCWVLLTRANIEGLPRD